MAITIIDRPVELRHYLVYDMEWIPRTLEIRMVGVMDFERGYRWYHSVREFLIGELTSKNRGKWFYAHFGGLADFQFVLEEIADITGAQVWQDVTTEGSTSGSSAIIVHVKKGKNVWHFIDSGWLLKEKLRSIGEWIGIKKGNADENVDFYRDASLAELRDYNEIDCRILLEAIRGFEEALLDLGGQLKMTQASCAMELFRRRFLTRDIETSVPINQIARQAYFASRVEVYSRECWDAYYYDINSSFPHAMTNAVPGDLMGTYHRRLPPVGIYLADVTVEVSDGYFPPLPYRQNSRIFFPVGTWRGWYTNVDLQLLQETGGRILEVHSSIAFEPNHDLRDYANTLFDLRKVSDGFFAIACKYLLNSLYGKFAESEWKSGFVLNPANPLKLYRDGWKQMFPGCFIYEKEVPIPHMHVPISVHITSIARRTIYNYMGMSSKVHYCDTDGFSSESELGLTGKDLGSIKLEKIIEHGEFVAAKVYKLEGWDAKSGERETWVKAKGFSIRDNAVQRFEKLQRGEEIEYIRMKRIKETIRQGWPHPEETTITKKLSSNAIPKRFFYPDGESRPWHIKEIEKLEA